MSETAPVMLQAQQRATEDGDHYTPGDVERVFASMSESFRKLIGTADGADDQLAGIRSFTEYMAWLTIQDLNRQGRLHAPLQASVPSRDPLNGGTSAAETVASSRAAVAG